MKDEFVVIDITTNGLDEDAEIVSFAALRFENGVPTERFFEYVNSGAVLSDSVSEILGITDDTLQRYGTTMEDAYWQFIEFCYDSNLVTMHHDFDNKFIERIRKDYDLPALENRFTNLDTLFHLTFNRGYSTLFAEKQFGITTDETGSWRHLDVAGKAYIALSSKK
ncbi:Exonuclease [Ruminococcus flavefaciens]|uniref:Exonuclease n=1 Tax=Ruminococcus flavefaciens TaxID=1265 RepID=A0A1H6LLG3_RUMFL|nr:3'-5' exonuclease [Ruminococcus flavefaciens]SEH85680.1 Exonuclease [Ruminococcus flavefaciens]